MTAFSAEMARLMDEQGLSTRALARKVPCDPGYVSRLRNGEKHPAPEMACRLGEILGAGDELAALAERDRADRCRPQPGASRPSRVLEALQAVSSGDAAGADIAIDSLAGLISHYNHVVSANPSAAVYNELLNVRSFAGSLLSQRTPAGTGRSDLIVITGLLSCLLAISATDIGDHASALVWCSDTERRGYDAGHPDLLGWAAVTRSLIAYYYGQPHRSAALARRGQEVAAPGTAAHARLAAQEMRSRAMLGDADGMETARRHAAAAVESLGPGAATTGAFSIPLDEDPPYTATSFLLVGRYREAAEVTRRVIAMVYRGNPGDQPGKYARTLLILGFAEAGLGRVDEACAAGSAALEYGQPAWPTMVLARRLDRFLTEKSRGSQRTAGYHARYIDAARRLPQAADLPRSGTSP